MISQKKRCIFKSEVEFLNLLEINIISVHTKQTFVHIYNALIYSTYNRV